MNWLDAGIYIRCFLSLITISDQSDGKTVLIIHSSTWGHHLHCVPQYLSTVQQQWENAMNTSELIKVHIFATCRGGSSETVAATETTQSKTMNPLRTLSITSAYIPQYNHLLNSLFSLAELLTVPVLILRTFGFLTLSSLKTPLFSISSTSGSRGRGGPGAVLCHFVFSKLLKYILLSADVTVAGRSELLFCHHLCLFERCCIAYFLHWPTATLRITTSARLHQHSHSLLPDFAFVCLQLAACPKSDCHLAPAPWRWLIVVNAAVWRMGGADSTNTHTHTDMQCVSDLCLSGSVCWAWWNLWSREG